MTGFTSLTGLVEPVVRILFYLGLLLGIGFIVYSGFLLMTSEGDPSKAREGQEQLTAAVIGIAFILLSVFILRIILNQLIGIPVDL